MRQCIVLLVGGLLFCIAGATAEGLKNPAVVPVPRETAGKAWLTELYDKLQKELSTRDLSQVNLLFVGDSITQQWLAQGRTYWEGSFAGAPYYALDLGVGGDRTEHVLYRLLSAADGGMGNLDDPRLKPKTIVLMIGTNNLFNHPADQIVEGVSVVCARLHELEPQARVILCSILPASAAKTRDIAVSVNRSIRTLPNVQWLDLYPCFVDENGEQRSEYFVDGVHLNESGYRIWRDLLLPVIAKE